MSTKKKTKRDNARRINTVLSLAQEELQVGKREVVTGRVEVRTVTDTDKEIVRQELRGKRVEFERQHLDRAWRTATSSSHGRQRHDHSSLEEVLVVKKRLVLKEELHITRHATTELTETPITVRKQRAVVEQLDSEGVKPDQVTKL